MLSVKKRGRLYRIDGRVAGQRVRFSLSTRHHGAAVLLTGKIERALAEGDGSPLWPNLAAVLPPRTFHELASIAGYVSKPPQAQPTWADLASAFTAYAEQLILRKRMSPTTLARYRQTIRAFGDFLSKQAVSALADISRNTIEQFKVWRLERIRSLKQSRGGGGLVLEIAILHRVLAYAVECELLPRNPVKLEGRPGDNPEGGAQPFTADQLSRLRQTAGLDLLAFLLLRWTGLRGSDAVCLRWEEIDWRTREINRVTQKRHKRVIVPIHPELLFALGAEFDKRKPRLDEPVLLNPATGKQLIRPRLYERFKALGKRAQVTDAHPHRLRDTFAVDMLLRGASPYDVAKLLGDTVDTVERYYAPFVRELRERTRRIMETGEGLEQTEKLGTIWARSVPSESRPN